VTFLRTVREGATDRSYGIHVADLAGVPEPVVDRSREVLDRLREEKAIEAKGGGGEPVQAVFDLESGRFRRDAETAADGGDDTIEATYGPEAEAVLSALAETDVAETPPVDLLETVQSWQSKLDTD